MLNQSLATILATLIGGVLSIVGGFFANYYIQSSSNRLQKQKEIRNILEHIYQSTLAISNAYLQIKVKSFYSKKRDIAKEYYDLSNNMSEIESMVDLYLSPLKENFLEYKNEVINSLVIVFDEKFTNEQLTWADKASLNSDQLEGISGKFRSSITKLLKEKGYSYF